MTQSVSNNDDGKKNSDQPDEPNSQEDSASLTQPDNNDDNGNKSSDQAGGLHPQEDEPVERERLQTKMMNEESKLSKELAHETDELWANIYQITNAIKTLEKSVGDLAGQITKSIENVNDRFVQQENKMKELDLRLDDKVVVFSDVIREELKKHVSSQVTSINSKIADIKRNFKNKDSTSAPTSPKPQPNTDDLNSNTSRLENRIDELELRFSELNYKELQEDLSKLSDDMNIDTKAIIAIEKDHSCLLQECNDRKRELCSLGKSLTKLRNEFNSEAQQIREEVDHLQQVNEKNVKIIDGNTSRLNHLATNVLNLSTPSHQTPTY